MQLLILECDLLDSEEVLGAEPVDRATWLMLLRYCAGRENGGRIEACAGWKDRKWQQLARVTYEEVRRETRLWQWQDDGLVVWGYPVAREEQVRLNRENGRLGGLAKAAKYRRDGIGYQVVDHPLPQPPPHPAYRDASDWASKTPTEKRREEKRREEESAVSETPLRAPNGHVISMDDMQPDTEEVVLAVERVDLAEIPCRAAKDGEAGRWYLTPKVADELRREYPSVDPVAVAEDMARKIRSGARTAPTVRGARRMLAAWVAREAASPTAKVNGAAATAARQHVGEPTDEVPWSVEDVRTYGPGAAQQHERWDDYYDDQEAADRWPWERFQVWLQRVETMPPTPAAEMEVVGV